MEWQGQAKESVINEIKTNKNHHHPRNKNSWVTGRSTKAQRSEEPQVREPRSVLHGAAGRVDEELIAQQ